MNLTGRRRANNKKGESSNGKMGKAKRNGGTPEIREILGAEKGGKVKEGNPLPGIGKIPGSTQGS